MQLHPLRHGLPEPAGRMQAQPGERIPVLQMTVQHAAVRLPAVEPAGFGIGIVNGPGSEKFAS